MSKGTQSGDKTLEKTWRPHQVLGFRKIEALIYYLYVIFVLSRAHCGDLELFPASRRPGLEGIRVLEGADSDDRFRRQVPPESYPDFCSVSLRADEEISKI